MLCGTCYEKTINKNVNENKDTIWDFNPFIYESFYDLKKGFLKFYKSIKDKKNFYKIFNEEGYNYSQWYIYYLSSNMYKYKKLHKNIVWFFQVISVYHFFKDFIKMGKKDDDRHHTLHHYLKYMTNIGNLQEIVLTLLIQNGLNMNDEDRQGYTCHDYINDKILEEKDKIERDDLTKKYKELENQFDTIIMEIIGNDMKKCEICNEFIEKYEDIKKLKLKNLTKENQSYVINIIDNIINYRQKCIDIYKKYNSCLNSLNRHQYVLDVYREILKC